MNHRLIAIFSIIASCAQSPLNNAAISDSTSRQSTQTINSVAHDSFPNHPKSDALSSVSDNGDDMMQNYFIVVADTSRNYFYLRNTMFDVSKKSGLIIDSLGRFFDPKRGIIVPDDSEDEIYAGAYFPRRFEGSELSIEYFKTYAEQSHQTNLAMIAGQYTVADAAQKQLRKIKQLCPNAFIIQAKLYNGCMH